jgi:hypothetical protein
MKKKDILVLIVSVVIIGASVFFMLQMITPKVDESSITTESEAIPSVPESLDETTYKNVEELSDYGEANLDGIGKNDLFAGF